MLDSHLKRILVPVDGSPVDEESLYLACSHAKRDRAQVVVLFVIEVPRTLALDADMSSQLNQGEQVLEELQSKSHKWGCSIVTDLIQAREMGPAIVDEVVERGIDLVAMGVHYHERFGGFEPESAVLYVLKNAPCRVLLVREPLKNLKARSA